MSVVSYSAICSSFVSYRTMSKFALGLGESLSSFSEPRQGISTQSLSAGHSRLPHHPLLPIPRPYTRSVVYTRCPGHLPPRSIYDSVLCIPNP